MKIRCNYWQRGRFSELCRQAITVVMAVVMLVSACPFDAYAAMTSQQPRTQSPSAPKKHAPSPVKPVSHPSRKQQPDSVAVRAATAALPDSIPVSPVTGPAEVVEDEVEQTKSGRLEVTPVDTVGIDINRQAIEDEYPEMSGIFAEGDSIGLTAGEMLLADSIAMADAKKKPDEWVPRKEEFNPDPTKAVWYAALFPGLGQVYNRRYWKLPIVVGGYLGLAYATTWNNGMLRDYSKAYSDLLDSDPNTKSYMDLFAPGVSESSLDKSWLENVIRSRKNYFRRNRDLCIICMVAVYLVAMVDAYVDASLSHFDITPELTMDVSPTLIQDGRNVRPSIGMVWALNF